MWRRPAALQPGAVIRLIACSGPVHAELLKRGVALLQSAGFTPRFAPQLLSQQHYLAGSTARRQAEWLAALRDPQAQAIWTARGGYGAAAALLEDVQNLQALRDEVAQQAKWLIGFSDISVLHSLWQQAAVCSVHAANVTNIGSWTPAAQHALFAYLKGQSQRQLFLLRAVGQPAAKQPLPSVVQGRLCGGNLTVLASLCGTALQPNWQGGIVVLEDTHETPYRLDRVATQLHLSGAFRGARAIVLGQLTDCRTPTQGFGAGCSAEAALQMALQPTGLPLFAGLPVGHAATAEALALGCLGSLDMHSGLLTIDSQPDGV